MLVIAKENLKETRYIGSVEIPDNIVSIVSAFRLHLQNIRCSTELELIKLWARFGGVRAITSKVVWGMVNNKPTPQVVVEMVSNDTNKTTKFTTVTI